MAKYLKIKGEEPDGRYERNAQTMARDLGESDETALRGALRSARVAVQEVFSEPGRGAGPPEDMLERLISSDLEPRPIEHDGLAKFVPRAMPFALADASAAELAEVLVWGESFLRREVELAVRSAALPASALVRVSDATVQAFVTLIGWRELSDQLGYNSLTGVHERLLRLVLGNQWSLLRAARLHAGNALNLRIARLLERHRPMDPFASLERAVGVGGLWAERDRPDEQWFEHAESWLSRLHFPVRDTAAAIRALLDADSVFVLLDDNGELVADLWMLLRLLEQSPIVEVWLLVPRWPLSRNMNLDTFERVVADVSYLSPLRRFIRDGRLHVVMDGQFNPSPDAEFLEEAARIALRNADCVLLKGASLFENFQHIANTRIHMFMVMNPSTRRITGLPAGSGYVGLIEPGAAVVRARNRDYP